MSHSYHSAASGSTDIPPSISAEFMATLRRFGVVDAELFGSTVRGEDRPDSDIDLIVAFDRNVPLFRQMDLAAELSRLSGRKVDLMTRIDPAFAPYIEPTLVTLPL